MHSNTDNKNINDNEIFEKEWYWVDTVNTTENYYISNLKQHKLWCNYYKVNFVFQEHMGPKGLGMT